MKILVVNCGSSSLKFQLIDSETEEVAASGLCERIGLDGALIYKVNGDKIKQEIDLPDHEVAIKKVLDTLLDKEIGVLTSKMRSAQLAIEWYMVGRNFLLPLL